MTVFVVILLCSWIGYRIGHERGHRAGVRLLLGPTFRAGERLGQLELIRYSCKCGAYQGCCFHL